MKHHPGSSTDKHNASLRRPASRIWDRILPLGAPGLGKQARRLFSRIWARPSRLDRVERANRADYADHEGPFPVTSSAGGWSRTEYGEYYATSVPVYAAIKMRADALARTPAAVYRRNSAGQRALVGAGPPGPATAGPGQPLVLPVRAVAGNRNLPEPVGRGLLGGGTGPRRPPGNLAPSARPDQRRTGPGQPCAGLCLSRQDRTGGLHSRRSGMDALLQPDGGVRGPVAHCASPDGGGHGTGRAALQPELSPATRLSRTSCC